jgi:futalosine hydrolase
VLLVVAATEAELRGADGVETLVCGIGPVDAAAATAAAIAERKPDALLNVGLAGCRRGCGLEPPQLVLGAEAVYEDAAGVLVEARVQADARLLELARRALSDAHVLPIGTSARVGGTSGCAVEAMEGFAVLRTAALAGVPALELRAIANEIEEADRTHWRFGDALAALEAVLPTVVRALG